MPWLGNIKDAVFDRCQRRMLMMESVGWYAHQLRDTHPPLVPPLRLHDTNAPFWHSSSALPREKPIELLYAGQFLGWMDGWMDGKCQLNLHNHNAYETKDTWFFFWQCNILNTDTSFPIYLYVTYIRSCPVAWWCRTKGSFICGFVSVCFFLLCFGIYQCLNQISDSPAFPSLWSPASHYFRLSAWDAVY